MCKNNTRRILSPIHPTPAKSPFLSPPNGAGVHLPGPIVQMDAAIIEVEKNVDALWNISRCPWDTFLLIWSVIELSKVLVKDKCKPLYSLKIFSFSSATFSWHKWECTDAINELCTKPLQSPWCHALYWLWRSFFFWLTTAVFQPFLMVFFCLHPLLGIPK